MSREFKFRVYVKELRKFIYFELGEFLHPERYLNQDGIDIQQFTGIKDAKGNPIYEGDIINFIPFGEKHTRVGVIVFENACYMAKSFNDVPQGYHIYFHDSEPEVVGNIYDLPCKPDHNGECMLCDELCSDCPFRKLN